LRAIRSSEGDVDDGDGYQSLEDLSVVRSKKYDNARFYFNGPDLVMIAVSEPSISAADIRSMMGDDVVELRSRQGKSAMIQVDAAAGLAFSSDDDEVGFLEIFPPTTADDYRQQIYWEPPAFRK